MYFHAGARERGEKLNALLLLQQLAQVCGEVIEAGKGRRVAHMLTVSGLEVAVFAQGLGGLEGIGIDDFIAQAGEFRIGEADMVERLELAAEVLFQRGLVADVGAAGVFELFELVDEALFDVVFFQGHPVNSIRLSLEPELIFLIS